MVDYRLESWCSYVKRQVEGEGRWITLGGRRIFIKLPSEHSVGDKVERASDGRSFSVSRKKKYADLSGKEVLDYTLKDDTTGYEFQVPSDKMSMMFKKKIHKVVV